MARYKKNETVEERRKRWREEARKWRAANRDKFMATVRKRNKANLATTRAKHKAWRDANREVFNERMRAYREAHPEVNKKAVRKYQEKNKQNPEWMARMNENAKRWRQANPEKAKEAGRRYHRVHSETDANYVIKTRLRSRLTNALKRKSIDKTQKVLSLIGCSVEFLRGYLEARFTKGMTWANINVDHHIPLAEFDLRDPDQQRQAFHYSNLKPLFAVDNFKKGAKRPPTHQAELI